MFGWDGKNRQKPLYSSYFFFFFFFLLIISRSGLLIDIWRCICISKSQKVLRVSFSRTDSGLFMYYFVVMSNFNFLHDSSWITFPTQSYLVVYYFIGNLLFLVITWLIVSFYRHIKYTCYSVAYNRFSLRYHHHHHHHVVQLARISPTLSRHFSLSSIASSWSSGLHPVSSHSCCMYVRAGRPAFAWPYVEVHRITSQMSSSLLLQQCPACLVRLTCIVFVMGGRWLCYIVMCRIITTQ